VPTPERLLIVGASGRAAAASARRAGLAPVVVDLFGDRDTRMLAEVHVCPPADYPAGLARRATALPPMPWLYTGGLENHPGIVAAISARHYLWGNGPAALKRVRDPDWLARTVTEVPGAYVPKMLPAGRPTPVVGTWLWKSRTGAGGLGVRASTAGEIAAAGGYLQKRAAGPVLSAQYVSGIIGCRLLGVTRQLSGTPWLNARRFAYAGNVGPGRLAALILTLELLGVCLAEDAGLIGAWGVDFVRTVSGAAVLEVNPRLTAAAEVLDLADRGPVVGLHRAACTAGTSAALSRPRTAAGKAVYYAPRRLTVPACAAFDAAAEQCLDPAAVPAYADLPAAGSVIEAGHPVVTLLARGPTAGACEDALRARAEELAGILNLPPG